MKDRSLGKYRILVAEKSGTHFSVCRAQLKSEEELRGVNGNESYDTGLKTTYIIKYVNKRSLHDVTVLEVLRREVWFVFSPGSNPKPSILFYSTFRACIQIVTNPQLSSFGNIYLIEFIC